MANNTVNGGNAVPDGWTMDDKTKTGKCHQCNEKISNKMYDGKMYNYQCDACGIRICAPCIEQAPEKDQYDKDAVEWHLNRVCWCKFDGGIDPKFIAIYGTRDPKKRTEEERRARESKGLAPIKRTTKQKKRNRRSALSVRDTASPGLGGNKAPEQPDDDFHEPQTSLPIRPPRSGLKRKNYHEGDSDNGDDVFVDGPVSRAKKRKRTGFTADHDDTGGDVDSLSHLQGTTTIIVGAGIVGMFIARTRAVDMTEASLDHHIVVVELRKSYCELASGHCAGFLSTSGMSEDWRPLADEAKKWWLDMLSSGEVRQSLQFNANTAIAVTEGGTISEHKVPSWLQQDAGLSLSEDANAIGRIDSVCLAEWLYSQCKALGVEFCFEHFVSDVDFAADGTLSGVTIQSTSSDNGSVTKLPCSNLVLAAGPFTTGIFKTLFKSTPLELENHVQRSHWFHISMTAVGMEEDETALRIPNAAENEKKLENEILIVPNVSDDVLAVSGTVSHTINEDLDFELALRPARGKTGELRGVAARYLDPDRVEVKEKSNIVDRGRSELSVANGMRPVIDRVPAWGVSGGVWLCYGFGKYGTMVAPGAAKILVSKMLGKRSDAVSADDSYRRPGPVEPQAKGKGRAKAW